MGLGVSVAGFVHFFVYHAFLLYQIGDTGAISMPQHRKFSPLSVSFAYGSLGLFVLGIAIVLWGVWKEFVLK